MAKKKPEKTQEQKINETIQAYKDIFSSPSGDLVLTDLEKKFSISSFSISKNNPIDPYRTHMDLGKLMVFGYINNQINRELISESTNE